MRLSLPVAITAVALSATACGSGSNASPTPTEQAASAPSARQGGTSSAATPSLRDAVQAYSDAYLTGDGNAAFGMLSKKCQMQIGRSSFMTEVTAAKQSFGHRLALSSFSSKAVDATHSLVTYTYPVSSINQHDQRWTIESGAWKYDAC